MYHAVIVQKVMNNSKMRVYASQDIVGVQLGGALTLKNEGSIFLFPP